jgi:HD-like signal output (HDOD) protein
MVYVLVVAVAALATAAMSKQSPQTATRVGVAAVAVAIVAVTIAEVTGDLLLFYLGALGGAFGVLVLLLRAATGLRGDAGPRPPRQK